jgi:hypothetical protein
MAIFEGIFMHSFPMLYQDSEGNEFYARIPEEELEIVYNSRIKWPITNDHAKNGLTKQNQRSLVIGAASDIKFIANSMLFANSIDIDKGVDASSLPTELSAAYFPEWEKLAVPYFWKDLEGRIGNAGKTYKIEYHHRNVKPNHLALVDNARCGKLAKLRQKTALVINSSLGIITIMTTKKPETAKTENPLALPDEKEIVANAENCEKPEMNGDQDGTNSVTFTLEDLSSALVSCLEPVMGAITDLSAKIDGVAVSNSAEDSSNDNDSEKKEPVANSKAAKVSELSVSELSALISNSVTAQLLKTVPTETVSNSTETKPDIYQQASNNWRN